jgi:hypothetical protein
MLAMQNATQKKKASPISKYTGPILGILGMFLALSAWSVASPVGSSPDDDFHLGSIWCGAGDRSGLCEPGSTPEKKRIPIAIAHSICFAYNADADASCQTGNLVISDGLFYETDRLNTTGLYPPVFYSMMSLFASDQLQISVVVIRLINALIFLALLASTWLLISPDKRRALLTSYAITMIPLGFFLVPSTNPSSWAISGIGALFFSVAELSDTQSNKRQAALGITAVIAFVLIAGSRGDGALFSIVAIAMALFVQPKIKMNTRWIYSSALLLAAVAALIFFSTGQASVANEGLNGTYDGTSQASSLNLLFANILNIPSIAVGIFGSWGLGWLDTVMPSIVWTLGLMVAGAVAIVGFGNTNLKKNVAALLVLVAVYLLPLYVLYKSHAAVGAYVQPRYVLPLVVLLVCISQLQTNPSNKNPLQPTQSLIVIAALSVAFSVSLHLNMDRYITGMAHPTWNLDPSRGWWWNVSTPPIAIWAIGSLGMILFLLFVFTRLHKKNNINQ